MIPNFGEHPHRKSNLLTAPQLIRFTAEVKEWVDSAKTSVSTTGLFVEPLCHEWDSWKLCKVAEFECLKSFLDSVSVVYKALVAAKSSHTDASSSTSSLHDAIQSLRAASDRLQARD